MRAVVMREFGVPATVEDVPDPQCAPDAAVIEVAATGLCRSDWHAWMGHDEDIVLPHVPGHELAGTVRAVGADVSGWQPGDRVTVPFVCACGQCEQCRAGQAQVCSQQRQPGFSDWGSFAELVAIPRAQANLVALPDDLDFATAASLGCRFSTAFHALTAQAGLQAGQWLAVHGCGGVGLSAVMIGVALGARVIAVDVSPVALAAARELGAEEVVTGGGAGADSAPAQIHRLTGGGAHVSVDAFGSAATARDSVRSLRRRGTHVQIGLMVEEAAMAPMPMARLVMHELRIVGSHGMSARDFGPMLDLVAQGRLRPDRLVHAHIGLDDAPAALADMDRPATAGPARTGGITVIEPGRRD
jgi:D-arabinose 1-dehydrogenase-like Zn-dependent alcohol dehydrogenase